MGLLSGESPQSFYVEPGYLHRERRQRVLHRAIGRGVQAVPPGHQECTESVRLRLFQDLKRYNPDVILLDLSGWTGIDPGDDGGGTAALARYVQASDLRAKPTERSQRD